MIDLLHHNLTEYPDWTAVLTAYRAEQEALEAARPMEPAPQPDAGTEEGTILRRPRCWVPRLRQVDTIDGAKLAPIHGKLIAHGYLRFQLQGRTDGVTYQVTKLGRELLTEAEQTLAALAEPTVDLTAVTDEGTIHLGAHDACTIIAGEHPDEAVLATSVPREGPCVSESVDHDTCVGVLRRSA